MGGVGNPVPPGGLSGAYPQSGSQQAFPQAQSSVSQAFPGDYRSQPQTGYDATSTGSIPGSVARSVSSSSNLLPSAAGVARQALPTQQSVQTQPVAVASRALEPMVQPALAAPSQPAQQAFPERPAQVSSIAPVNPAYVNKSDPVLAPDPIVTGSAPQAAGWTTTGGTRITLGPDETIYNLSKRYGVPASEIMKANGISDPSKVASGRQLLIPVYVYSRQAPVSAPDNNPKTRSAKSSAGLQGEASQNNIPLPAPSPQRDAAVLPNAPVLRNPKTESVSNTGVTASAANPKASNSATGNYTVKGGDTLSRIARAHGVGVDALKSANGLTGSNIRIGQSLAIPAAGAETPDNVSTASIPTEAAPKSYTPPVKTAGDGVAAKTNADVASIAPAASGIGKFRWPARGQVITGFAKSENGKRNDGIDISMPAGTPVKAAENGVVIYSGDGLKEYGKTILIRHDDGLVTVYAHAQSLNVNRGDKVIRGQVVASSGMSGVAKTPRLHFEVRKNASPVDPTAYLE
ncbi:metalloendopeptidase-like membrane protein [Hoeflea sp. IMCC20628]|nr:metalloendopeptidase-like membrane protein [Hoeflea sp. IMCC20628]